MKTITHISRSSMAKVLGGIYAGIGIVVGIFIFIISVATAFGGQGIDAIILGILMPFILGAFYGVIGLIIGFVVAWIYNVTTKYTGGLKITLED